MIRTERAKEYLRAILFAALPRPSSTGPYDVGSLTSKFDVAPDGAAASVSLYYPCDRSPHRGSVRLAGAIGALAHPTRAGSRPGAALVGAESPFTLLLYFPSWFSHAHESSFTLANLASHGFVVASIDDVGRLARARGRDGVAQMAGLDMTSLERFSASRSLAGRRAGLEARIGSAVVDRIAGSERWGRHIDANRVGAMGFSFGGNVAATMSRSDPRVRAVVNLDGSLFGEVARLGVDVPFLTLLAGHPFPTEQELNQPDLGARFEAILERDAVDRQLQQDERPDSWTFVIERISHLDLSDRLLMPAFADRGRARDLDRVRIWADVNLHVLGFLDAVLRGGSKRSWLGGAPGRGMRTLEAMRDTMTH